MTFLHVLSYLLPIIDDDFSEGRIKPETEKQILKNIAKLYDFLADAVDEINAIFSKLVNFAENFLKLDLYVYLFVR
jgi:hypothetical protein